MSEVKTIGNVAAATDLSGFSVLGLKPDGSLGKTTLVPHVVEFPKGNGSTITLQEFIEKYAPTRDYTGCMIYRAAPNNPTTTYIRINDDVTLNIDGYTILILRGGNPYSASYIGFAMLALSSTSRDEDSYLVHMYSTTNYADTKPIVRVIG